MESGLPGRREWGASGAVFKQTLKKLVLLLKLLDRTIAVKFLTSTAESLDEEALIREARSLAEKRQPVGA